MKGALHNKVVIITGASSGIGAATAVRVAQEGAAVVITARNLKGLDAVAQTIRKAKGNVMSIKVDVCSENDIKDMISIVKNKLGRIDAIVNNAGVFYTGAVDEIETDKLDEMLTVNLRGLYLCCKYAAKVMKRQKYGHIINISSLNGRLGKPERSAYAASKFGVTGISESIAEELKPFKIKVSLICPGAVETPMHFKRKTRAELARMLKPEDVAELIMLMLKMPPRANITEAHLRPVFY
ncbi:SDR family oxidoreductase [Candidatus Woesearchaeota archaeon]|nr:SDR family oxidoreductase [Candidatus Woesearchaeota archaeon]